MGQNEQLEMHPPNKRDDLSSIPHVAGDSSLSFLRQGYAFISRTATTMASIPSAPA